MTRAPVRRRAALVTGAVLYLLLYLGVSEGARGDGFYTYQMVESLVFDGDLDLHNQFAAAGNPWGYTADPDTGYLRMRYEVWPLVVWAPLMLLGRLCAWLSGPFGGDADAIVQLVTLSAAPLSALLGALFIARLLERYVATEVAWLTAAGSITASHLAFYALFSPAYAHPLSFALSALLLERCDAYSAPERPLSTREALLLGALLGALMDTRPQTVVFGLLLLWPLWRSARASALPRRALARHAAVAALACALCFAPTLLLFQRVYGSAFESFQGPHFMRWSTPWLSAVWFASAGGLFPWTPGAYVGISGWLALLRSARLRVPCLLLLAVFVVHSYVNACAWDYWGGVAFGARRESELLPLLAVGVAAVLSRLLALFETSPKAVFATLGALGLAFTGSLYLAASQALIEGRLPLEGPSRFETRVRSVAGRWAQAIDDSVGDPFALPASLPFAVAHGVAPFRYSCVVGRSFLQPSAADRRIFAPALLDAKRAADRCLFADGFRTAGKDEGRTGLLIEARSARVLVPVHTATALRLHVKYVAARPCKVLLTWEGAPLGGFEAAAGEGRASVGVAREQLRSEVQELSLFTSEPGCLRVEALLFEPLPGP